MAKDSIRTEEMLQTLKGLKESLHLSVAEIHRDLNENYLSEEVDLSTIYRWLDGTHPRGEHLLAIQEWIGANR